MTICENEYLCQWTEEGGYDNETRTHYFIDFIDEEFEVIYLNSLHHLHPNVNDAIQEFKRILKPNGYIILWEPSSESLLDIFRRIWYIRIKYHFCKIFIIIYLKLNVIKYFRHIPPLT